MSKRVLVTGAAGFFGHHLVEHILRTTDWEIVALVRLSTVGDLSRLTDIECMETEGRRVKLVYHDLKSALHAGIREHLGDVDYVLHIAANSHVDRSIAVPLEFFADNVMGTVNLLEWVRHYQPNARVINFGTDEVFGPAPDDYDFTEEDRYRPSNPYAASKAGQIAAGHSYCVTYGLDLISTYTMNLFGERQNPEKFVPMCIENALRRHPQPIHAQLGPDGSVEYVGERHWLHARNAADALLFLLAHGKKGEHYNVVGETHLHNDALCRLINEMLGTEPLMDYVDFHRTRPGHDRRYALDGSKLAQLGWKPAKSFEASLEKMVRWTVDRRTASSS
jgi:dTDP-glucose 4,6-dehydratase